MMQQTMERFARWMATPEGVRHIEKMEREGEKRAAEIAKRHELAADIEEARRVKSEDLPPAREDAERLHAEWQEKRKEAEAARRRWGSAFNHAMDLSFDSTQTIGRSQNLLRWGADARLCAAAERIHHEVANWHHTWSRLAVSETVGEFMEAYTRIVNQEELDGLQGRLRATEAALAAIRLVPEPAEEEILRLLGQAEAVLGEISRQASRRGGA